MTIKCEKCGLPLAFELKDGKLWPVNPDGSFHFDICRQVAFENAKKHGKPFEETDVNYKVTARGIQTEDKRIYTEIIGKTITGKKYFDTKHNCIPWEPCEVCAPLIAARKWK